MDYALDWGSKRSQSFFFLEDKANLNIKEPSLILSRRAGGIDPSSLFPVKFLQEGSLV